MKYHALLFYGIKGGNMGFNSYYVDLHVNSKTISRYEKLGYIMPKKINEKKNKIVYDTSKTVKIHVNDLPLQSNTKIDYLCDNCGEPVNVSWRRYCTYNINGKYYCRKCKQENPKFIKWLKPREKTSRSRSSSDYNIFTRTVLFRDHFICQYCGQKGKKEQLDVHHLNGYQWYVDGRTDPANGVVLCNEKLNGCHECFHAHYGKIKNTKEQFEEWIGHKLSDLDKYEKLPSFPKVYCIEDNTIYESIYDCAKQLNCSSSYVYQMCHGDRNTYKDKHYVYFDAYTKMTPDDIEKLFTDNIKRKSVIYPELGNIFRCAREAGEHYHMKTDKNISACCHNRKKHSGKCNGIRLSWMFYEDYLKLSSIEKIKLINENLETLEEGSFLMDEYKTLIKVA